MTVTLDHHSEQDQLLRQAFGDELSRLALEALIIEGYRTRKYGLAGLRRLLRMDNRWDAEKWLQDRKVPSNYSVEDFESDVATLDALRRDKA